MWVEKYVCVDSKSLNMVCFDPKNGLLVYVDGRVSTLHQCFDKKNDQKKNSPPMFVVFFHTNNNENRDLISTLELVYP